MPAVYLVLGIAWVLGTDSVLGRVLPADPASIQWLAWAKSLGFVAISALWFHLALRGVEAAAQGRRPPQAPVSPRIPLLILIVATAGVASWWRRHRLGVDEAMSAVRSEMDLQREHFAMANRFANDAVLLVDAQWRIIAANDRAALLYRRSIDELCQLQIDDLRGPDPEGSPSVPRRFGNVPDAGQWLFRTVNRDADGRTLHVEVSARRFELAGEVYVQAIIRDVSAQVAVEAALQESESRYRRLFMANPHPMWVYDIDTLAFLAVNDAAVKHYGYGREQFLCMTIADIRPPADLPRLLSNISRLREDKLDEAGTWRHLRADGSLIEVEISGHLMDYEGRRVELILSHDVTGRRRLERELRDNEERLRLALMAAEQGLYDLDLVSGQAVVSPEYALMLGYDPEAFVETNEDWRQRMHPDDRDPVYTVFQDYVAGRRDDYRVEFRQRCRDGSWKWVMSVGKIVERGVDGSPLRMLGTHTDIHDRKMAELALAEVARDLKESQRLARVGSWSWELANSELCWSDEIYRICGVTPDRFQPDLDAFLEQLALPQDHSQARAWLADIVAGRASETFHFRVRRPGGEVRHLINWVETFNGTDGRPTRVLGTTQDVTELTLAQRQLEQQRDLYDLLSQCNQLIVRVEERDSLYQGVVELAVDRGKFLFAFIAEVDARGAVVPAARHGPDQGYIDRLCPSRLDTLPEGAGPTGIAVRSGRAVVCNDFLADPVTGPWHEAARAAGIASSGVFPVLVDGEVCAVLNLYAGERGFFHPAIVQTLEEMSKDIGFALRGFLLRRDRDESRNLLQSIIDASGALIYAFDLEGRALMMNAACARVMGGERNRLIGMSRESVMPPEQAAEHRLNDRRVIEAQVALTFEEHNIEEGLETTYLSTKFPLRDLDGRIYAVGGVSADVTPLQRAQRELEEANRTLEARVEARTADLRAAKEQAEAADRAKSIFLTTISHELRAPLHSIIGFNAIITDEMRDRGDGSVLENLQIIGHSARHLLQIINDLLDISRIEAGAVPLVKNEFALQPLLQRLVQRFGVQAREKRLLLSLDCDAPGARLVTDERRVEQVLGNLIANAVKYTASGEVRVSCKLSPAQVRVDVTDTGRGIATQDMGKLFRHFSQLAPADGSLTDGAGLGLAIAAGLAGAMGGEIQVDSQEGVGSTFSLILPRRTGC